MTSHPQSLLLLSCPKAYRTAGPTQTTRVPAVMIICFFLSAGGTCSHIPQPEHGSNTNKVVGGNRLCVCVCAWTPAWCLLCAVFPAATFAGATCELYSLSVIKILYKAILEPHAGFRMCLIVFVGVFLCHSVSVCICACACLCVKRAIRGSCASGLRGPPTEALFSKQRTEKGWRSQTRRDTHHLRGDWCLSPSSSSFFCETRRTSGQCPISPLTAMKEGEFLQARLCVWVCVSFNAFPPEYHIRPGQFASTDVPTTLPKPQWLNNSWETVIPS